jgi:hypothetical protein
LSSIVGGFATVLHVILTLFTGDDSSSTKFNPQSVKTTISWFFFPTLRYQSLTSRAEFRGLQAAYTFPVGVTTLSWYASPNGHARSENGTVAVEVAHEDSPETSTILATAEEANVDEHETDNASNVTSVSDSKLVAAISHARAVHHAKHVRSRLARHH